MQHRIGLHLMLNSLGVGGAERHTVALANHLPLEQFRIHLSYLFPQHELLPEVAVDRLDSLTCHNVRHRLDLRTVRTLAARNRDADIDIVLCTNAYPALYGMFAALHSGHRVRRAVVYHTTTLHSRKDRMQIPLYREVFRRFDLLVFVSRAQQAYWQGRGLQARRTMFIHNGIDLDRFTTTNTPFDGADIRADLGLKLCDYVIGICAALRPEKAHRDYLRAIANLHARGVPARGLIIGDGPMRSDVERQIHDLGLDAHVKITGMQGDVRPFIKACDVMTLTSHSVETFSLAALESMAMGKPVVMTDIGGAREQVEHGVTGLIYQPGDTEALTRHLNQLLDPAVRTRMASAALARVTNLFSLPTMINSYTQALIGLAASAPGAGPDRQ